MTIEECLIQLNSSNPFMHGFSNITKMNDYISSLINHLEYAKSMEGLPSCNECKKKSNGSCRHLPRYGDWCRLNCFDFEEE